MIGRLFQDQHKRAHLDLEATELTFRRCDASGGRGVDEDGYPVRDEDSTTYVGAIETAEECGKRIYAEALRRGLHRARRSFFWEMRRSGFTGLPRSTSPRQLRLSTSFMPGNISRSSANSSTASRAKRPRSDDLDDGAVEKVLAAMRCLKPASEAIGEELLKTMGYFENTLERLRYADFREQGLFVGSGVVEAGCKAVVGHRLKQSGMRWTVQGANAIIALRCCQRSGRWEEFWENRVAS